MTHSTQNRYYTAIHGADPKRQGELRRLNNFIAGEWKPSRTAVYRDAFNPSTGEVIAKVPASLPDELIPPSLLPERLFRHGQTPPCTNG